MYKLNILLNSIFFIIFFVHVTIICYQSAYPDVPEIFVYKKKLADMDFPLLFKICLFETEETTRFTNLGYFDVTDYFLGISLYNSSIRGWAGHMENFSTIETVEGKLVNT